GCQIPLWRQFNVLRHDRWLRCVDARVLNPMFRPSPGAGMGEIMRLKPSQNLDSSRYDFAGSYLQKFGTDAPGAIVYDIGTGEAPMRPAVEKAELKWRGFDLFPRAPD